MREGEEVTLGSSTGYQMSLRLSENDWARDLNASKVVGDDQVFVRGPLELHAMTVTLAGDGEADTDRLWEGFGNVLRTKDADVRLGDPSRITSAQGVEGFTADVEGGEHKEVAVLYPAPDGQSAVQLVLRARGESADLGEAIGTVAGSVAFTGKEAGA